VLIFATLPSPTKYFIVRVVLGDGSNPYYVEYKNLDGSVNKF